MAYFTSRITRCSRGRNSCHQEPPAQTRTCGFPASGSSVVLAFARIFTVTRYKIQLLLPAVRLAYVYPALHVQHKFPLWATYFRQVLSHANVTDVMMACTWLSHAQSTMPDKTPQSHTVSVNTCLGRITHDQELLGLPEFSTYLFLHATA